MAVKEFSDMTPEGKRYMKQLKELADLEVCVGYQDGVRWYLARTWFTGIFGV